MNRIVFFLIAIVLTIALGVIVCAEPQAPETDNKKVPAQGHNTDALPRPLPPVALVSVSDPLPFDLPVRTDIRRVGNGQLIVQVEREGQPVPGTTVIVSNNFNQHGWPSERSACADASGTARFTLSSGTYDCQTIAGGQAKVLVVADAQAHVTLQISKAVTLRGKVTDPSTQPIAGASILVAAPGCLSFHAVTKSAADGSYAIDAISLGCRVTATNKDHAPSPSQLLRAKPSQPSEIFFVLEPLFARLSGIVTDSEGRPIAGAQLFFGEAASSEHVFSRASLQCISTDAAGLFTSPNLAQGRLLLRGLAHGFGPFERTIFLNSSLPDPITLTLEKGASVCGIVCDTNNQPIAAATVWSGDSVHSFGSQFTHSNSDGSFCLSDLPAGPLLIAAFALPDKIDREELHLQAGTQSEWHPNLSRRSTADVHGKLVDNNNLGAKGYQVIALDRTARLRSGTVITDDDGAFLIKAFASGTQVQVAAYSPNQSILGFPAAVCEGVEAGGQAALLRLDKPDSTFGTIRGTVKSPDGRGVTARIEIQQNDKRASGNFVSAPDGSFVIDRIPAGNIQLLIEHDVFSALRRTQIFLQPRATLDLGICQLGAGAVIHGTLASPDGAPVGALAMRVIENGNEIHLVDCTNGSYRTVPLRPGNYVLLLQAEGLAAGRVPVTLGDTDLQKDLTLKLGFPCQVQLQAAAGGLDARWTSLLIRDSSQQPIYNAGLPFHDRVANFMIWLEPGTYQAYAVDDDGHEARFTLTCSKDERQELLVLQLH